MNPPSGVHTGRVSTGQALSPGWVPTARGTRARCLRGHGIARARASAAEWAPAAITTAPASVVDPSEAVTRTPVDARVNPVTRPLPGAFARVPS